MSTPDSSEPCSWDRAALISWSEGAVRVRGFMNAILQFPGTACGLIESPLDSWLFAQINGGNCLSLVLNKNFGWAADVNLRFIFDRFFSVERGSGYPEHRKEPQRKARMILQESFPNYPLLSAGDPAAVGCRGRRACLDLPGFHGNFS